jgi:hypothetical protein
MNTTNIRDLSDAEIDAIAGAGCMSVGATTTPNPPVVVKANYEGGQPAIQALKAS